LAPSIIFIDEIDAVGKKRDQGKMGSSNDEKDNTLNQLLVEMDGFSTDSQVIVLAATNRKDILDSALMRPGRFDRTVDITLPDIKEREEILNVHLSSIKLDEEVGIQGYARKVASLTPGMSGAELANVCNEAAILAARKDLQSVNLNLFERATERVIGGIEKKSSILSPHERRVVAFHESGHAVASWFLEGANPLVKVTIIPRSKGALGFAQYLPDEISLYSKDQLLHMICTALGGRIAEELIFNSVTTGAADDLNKVRQIAYALVTQYGMSSRIGLVSYEQPQDGFSKPAYSEATAQTIDEEVKKIVDDCYITTKTLLQTHQNKL
jgi:AFG3 family protein